MFRICISIRKTKNKLVNNRNEILIIYDSDYVINDNFYNKENHKLIIFTSQNITIFDLDDLQVEKTFNFLSFVQYQFIEEFLLDDNLLCNGFFLNSKTDTVESLSISIDKAKKKSNNSTNKEIKEFLKNIINSISDIGFLLSI